MSALPVACGVCKSDISPKKNRAVCNSCKNELHLKAECAGVQESTWKTMSKSNISSWVCKNCRGGAGARIRSDSTDSTHSQTKKRKPDESQEAEDSVLINEDRLFERLVEFLEKQFKLDIQNEVKNVMEIWAVQQDEKMRRMEGEMAELRQTNENLEGKIRRLERDRNEAAQYSRRSNVIVTGVPKQQDETPEGLTNVVFQMIGVDKNPWDVVAAHRLPMPKKIGAESERAAACPIVIKLQNRMCKEQLINAAKLKKPTAEMLGGSPNTRVYISEHLTKQTLELKMRARRDLENWKYIWVKEGKVKARREENGRVFHITDEADIVKLQSMA